MKIRACGAITTTVHLYPYHVIAARSARLLPTRCWCSARRRSFLAKPMPKRHTMVRARAIPAVCGRVRTSPVEQDDPLTPRFSELTGPKVFGAMENQVLCLAQTYLGF